MAQGSMPEEQSSTPSHTAKFHPKDCRVCPEADVMLKAFAKFRMREGDGSASQPAAPSGGVSGSDPLGVSAMASRADGDGASSSNEPASGSSSQQDASSCPPDSTTLGRSTWVFLHTMAAYYPQKPTDQQQQHMREFVRALGEFYPCEVCAEHFRHEAHKHPPEVEDNLKLSNWFCKMHNKVNEVLGKPLFDCSKVFERWRDGPSDGSCD